MYLLIRIEYLITLVKAVLSLFNQYNHVQEIASAELHDCVLKAINVEKQLVFEYPIETYYIYYSHKQTNSFFIPSEEHYILVCWTRVNIEWYTRIGWYKLRFLYVTKVRIFTQMPTISFLLVPKQYSEVCLQNKRSLHLN